MKERDLLLWDFVTLFNAFWYRDFPISEQYKPWGSRVEWTTHFGLIVRACADAMGFFTYFESGGRTDAIIKDNQRNHIAHLEWEWTEAFSPKVNEIQKLLKQNDKTLFSVFISYSEDSLLEKNLQRIAEQWQNCPNPLLVFLVIFSKQGNRRDFKTLNTYLVRDGVPEPLRSQQALPWNVEGSRWQSIKEHSAT